MAQNTHLKTAAVGKSTLSHGAIGAASAWIGASVIDFPPSGGTNWNLFAGAHTRFIDDIEVTSASLPVGTEVPILFSLHVSSSINAAHSALPGGSNNRAFVRQMIDAGTVGPGGNRFDVEAEDNNAFRDTTGSVPNQNNGLLNPNTPHLDYLFDAKVGDTLTFFVLIDSDVIGNLSPITVSTNPVVLDNATGQALGSIGVAFGASPINPDMSPNTDVILMSQQFGGPFSPSSSASAANAALGEPANPIPEPSSLLIAVAGLLVVVFRRLVLLLRSD